ncbi:hypothetical protein HF086_006326 [Spodoptera exigua]|uniref:Uncharacterized protein n=1 Tax=Spodoptera exigua TaxID=7107 RepID=A0A922MR79_SPOEX|nr:hypothetical protein HF086_006326 [Spodoptera exigua]
MNSCKELVWEKIYSGVRTHGESGWTACWRALTASSAAPRPLYSHRALLVALASPKDDWLFYRWRGAAGVWRVLRPQAVLPPAALQAAARCLYQPYDYYRFKELFGDYRGASTALDTIALNAAWVLRADSDLLRYFTSLTQH